MARPPPSAPAAPAAPRPEEETVEGLRSYLRLFRPYSGRIAVSLAFAIVKHSALLFLPLLIARAIDKAIPGRDRGHLLLLLAGMAAVVLLNLVTVNIYQRIKTRVLRSVMGDLRSFICARMQQLAIAFYDRNHTGRLQNKIMTDVDRINSFGSYLFEPFATSVAVGAAMIAICLLKEPRATFILCICLPLFVLLNKRMEKRLVKSREKLRKANERLAVSVGNMLQTMRLTRAHGEEEKELRKIESSNRLLVEAGMRMDMQVSNLGAGIWGVGQVSTILILGLAGFAAMASPPRLTLGEVTLFLAYFTQINGFISAIVGGYDIYLNGRDAMASLSEITHAPDRERNEGLPGLGKVEGRIEFRDVFFRYPERTAEGSVQETEPPRYALRGVSLSIAPGERVALVGASGSGKSTLVALILGFYRPTAGKVLIDGRDGEAIDMRTFRRQVGVVSQDNVLFEGTLRQNIAHGREQVSEEALIEAARMANAHDFIAALPQGYETWVGERGISLSGGQRQRVAIARALLRNPAVLLLDEATSALDTVAEEEVQSALERLMRGRTTLTIAHRLSTIRHADRILVFEEGRVVEEGRHEDLSARDRGAYRKLLRLPAT